MMFYLYRLNMADAQRNGTDYVRCPCSVCQGHNLVCKKTRKRHMSIDTEQAWKTPRTSSGWQTLHPGTSVTPFTLMMQVLSIFNDFAGVTQNCVTEILHLVRDVLGDLPGEDDIPADFHELETRILPYLVMDEVWSTCPQECNIFKGSKHGCDKCDKNQKGRTYHYMPLIPRLKDMYSDPNMAKLLQSHNTTDTPNETRDIQDSEAWFKLYGHGQGGVFENNPRAVSLQFSADGFAPWHHTTSAPYSVEQQASVVLNFPPGLRTKPGFVLLHGLIPGKYFKMIT